MYLYFVCIFMCLLSCVLTSTFTCVVTCVYLGEYLRVDDSIHKYIQAIMYKLESPLGRVVR